MAMAEKSPLSAVIPAVVIGSATFTPKYALDPFGLPTTRIVHRALDLGIRAFDTSPYYGPAEELLGAAFDTPFVKDNFKRDELFLQTKVGRIGNSEFDYSPVWVGKSLERSLKRLRTNYFDLVYCHDVEFVTLGEVVEAVRELRRIRDTTGKVKYVGISGYPVPLLCELAEAVLRDTGEPLDAVMSYANYTLQNTTLASLGVPRLQNAGVSVVSNASPLGMGLLRTQGVPIGATGDFHPADSRLREQCSRASQLCQERGQKLEVVALRYALEKWLQDGIEVGTTGDLPTGRSRTPRKNKDLCNSKLGVTVLGCSYVEELDETMELWRAIVGDIKQSVASKKPQAHVEFDALTDDIRRMFNSHLDTPWLSPPADYVQVRSSSAEENHDGEKP